MRMLRANLLVQPMSKEQLGKIVMPDTVNDVWKRGKVITIGPDVEGDIKIGDIVIFPPFYLGGEYPTVGSEGFIIVEERLLWAIED